MYRMRYISRMWILQTIEQIFNFKFLISAYARAQARTRARAGYTFIMDNKQPYVV